MRKKKSPVSCANCGSEFRRHALCRAAACHDLCAMPNLRCERLGPFDTEELREELTNLEFEYMMDLAPSKPPSVVLREGWALRGFATSNQICHVSPIRGFV